MTRQLINTGIIPNDGQGDSLRDAGGKMNNNFQELYTALGNGTALTIVNNNLITATGANKITFLYSTLADLPDAATYHGMFAHVHGENASYYAHAGAWVKIADANKSFGMFSDVDLTATPTNGQALVYDSGSQTWKPGTISGGGGGGGGATAFLGLTDTPSTYSGLSGGFLQVNGTADGLTIVAAFSIDKLSDVDTTTSAPSSGQVLKWNGTKWAPADDSTSGGGAADAGTLDGLDSTYFLNYNNLNNKPTVPSSILTLTDTPATFSGQAGKTVKVNAGATALEFVTDSGGGASTLNDLTDVTISTPAQGDVLYYNGTGWVKQNGPTMRWDVGASGSSNYTFTGPGFASTTNDPVLYLMRGHSYIFVNSTGASHPFEFRVSNGGAEYTAGISGSKTGTQVLEVPMDAPSTLYYQCTIHSGMGNTINIVS
jgi:hypothetical protein